MKEPLHIAEVIEEIETEMVKMWACDEATYVMEHDEEYIVMVLTCLLYTSDAADE